MYINNCVLLLYRASDLKFNRRGNMETEIVITEDDFREYESVRASGVTNMFMVTTVCDLSGLERRQVMHIMKNYVELNKKYPNVRKEQEEIFSKKNDEDDDEEEDDEM